MLQWIYRIKEGSRRDGGDITYHLLRPLQAGEKAHVTECGLYLGRFGWGRETETHVTNMLRFPGAVCQRCQKRADKER